MIMRMPPGKPRQAALVIISSAGSWMAGFYNVLNNADEKMTTVLIIAGLLVLDQR
jgi:hypothetical protein